MPVLSEDEQRTCIGGEIYYSTSGIYLGKKGESDEFRVIDYCDYSNTNLTDEDWRKRSSSFSSWTIGGLRETILTDAVQRFGTPGSGATVDPSNPDPDVAGWYSGMGIRLNSNSFFFRNVADIKIAIIHEQAHERDPATFKDTEYTLAKKEYSAYWAAKMSPYFSEASPEARKIIEDQIEYQNKVIKKYEE